MKNVARTIENTGEADETVCKPDDDEVFVHLRFLLHCFQFVFCTVVVVARRNYDFSFEMVVCRCMINALICKVHSTNSSFEIIMCMNNASEFQFGQPSFPPQKMSF